MKRKLSETDQSNPHTITTTACTSQSSSSSLLLINNNNNGSGKSQSHQESLFVPKYGSQEYWEKRYKRNIEHTQGGSSIVLCKSVGDRDRNRIESNSIKCSTDQKNVEKENMNDEDDNEGEDSKEEEEEELSPGHEWYFSYEELQSLILPLILGCRGDEFDNWSDDDDEHCDEVDEYFVIEEEEEVEEAKKDDGGNNIDQDDNDADAVKEEGVEHHESQNIDNQSTDEANGDGNEERNVMDSSTHEEYEEIEVEENLDYDDNDNSDDDDDEIEEQDFLAAYQSITKDDSRPSSLRVIPKKILEIGCGDMPLGRDLCQNLLEYQSATNNTIYAKSIVDEIVCFDYSQSVIELVTQQQEGEILNHQCKASERDNRRRNLDVTYEVLDARELPFNEKKFDLILDKGTLDAMLSDKDQGIKNCIKIVSEASRVLSMGGRWKNIYQDTTL